jgi:hypothetical protein
MFAIIGWWMGVVYASSNCRRIEKEFIYRKEKQAQDNAAMAVSQ